MSDEEKTGLDSMSFKLSPAEKKKITDEAATLNISISEYIRIKALMDENDVITVKEENRKLKKELNELKVKNSYYKKTERHSEGIVLKVDDEDQELLLKILDLDKIVKVRSKSIEGKIISIVMEHYGEILNESEYDFQMVRKIFRYYKNDIMM